MTSLRWSNSKNEAWRGGAEGSSSGSWYCTHKISYMSFKIIVIILTAERYGCERHSSTDILDFGLNVFKKILVSIKTYNI